MNVTRLLFRRFTVGSAGGAAEEHAVVVGLPYLTDDSHPLGLAAACELQFGPVSDLISHTFPGFDEFEALENAMAFANFYLHSLGKTNTIRFDNDVALLEELPSAFSVELRGAFDSVLHAGR